MRYSNSSVKDYIMLALKGYLQNKCTVCELIHLSCKATEGCYAEIYEDMYKWVK